MTRKEADQILIEKYKNKITSKRQNHIMIFCFYEGYGQISGSFYNTKGQYVGEFSDVTEISTRTISVDDLTDMLVSLNKNFVKVKGAFSKTYLINMKYVVNLVKDIKLDTHSYSNDDTKSFYLILNTYLKLNIGENLDVLNSFIDYYKNNKHENNEAFKKFIEQYENFRILSLKNVYIEKKKANKRINTSNKELSNILERETLYLKLIEELPTERRIDFYKCLENMSQNVNKKELVKEDVKNVYLPKQKE